MQPVTYRRRHNALSRGEREWRVEEDALVSVGASGHLRRWAWKDMVSVRLCFDPTRYKPWRYTFELQPKHGAKIDLDNAHYVSIGSFEERSQHYTPFVRAALERLAQHKPDIRVLIGETPKRYFFLMLAALVGMGAAAVALIAFPTPLDALPFAALAKLLLILLMLPVFGIWVIRAMPKGVSLDAVPERAFPPADGAGAP